MQLAWVEVGSLLKKVKNNFEEICKEVALAGNRMTVATDPTKAVPIVQSTGMEAKLKSSEEKLSILNVNSRRDFREFRNPSSRK